MEIAFSKIINKNEYEKWNEFVKKHPEGTVYHTSYWAEVVRETYKFNTIFLVFQNDKNEILAGIPITLIKNFLGKVKFCSVACAHMCSPLLKEGFEPEKLYRALIKFQKNQNCYECRIKIPKKDNTLFDPFIKQESNYSTFILPIDRDIKDIFYGFHKSCIANPIKKRKYNNLEIIKAKTTDDINIFYSLYSDLRKRKGKFPQPLKFFHNIHNILAPLNIADTWLVKLREEYIAAAIFLNYGNVAIYEYGASKSEFVKHRPNHYLLWEAIKYANRKGFKIFDFGRTTDDNFGLHQFKKRWGGNPVRIEYLNYYLKKPKNSNVINNKSIRLEEYRNIIKKTTMLLPKKVNEIIGNFFYKYTLF